MHKTAHTTQNANKVEQYTRMYIYVCMYIHKYIYIYICMYCRQFEWGLDNSSHCGQTKLMGKHSAQNHGQE